MFNPLSTQEATGCLLWWGWSGWPHNTEDMPAGSNPGLTLHQRTKLCKETVFLFTCSLPGEEPTPCLGPSCRVAGVMLEGAGSAGRDCGARVESCVVGQCTCASGCQSPGISRVLDSWEHNAGKLMWKEVTARKWKRLEAYQRVKPRHNIPPGQIRITLMQWFIIFFLCFSLSEKMLQILTGVAEYVKYHVAHFKEMLAK